MLGKAKELEKNMVYAYPEWDSPMHRVKAIRKGKEEVIITHQDGERRSLKVNTAVRFFEVGREPSAD